MSDLKSTEQAAASRLAPSPHMGSKKAQRLRVAVVQSMGIGVFYVLVVVYFSLRVPNFLSLDNVSGILTTSAALGLVAIGQTFAIVSGGFDLSVGGVVPLAAVVFATTANSGSLVTAMLVAILTGCVAGVVNAVVIARFKINPLITTLGMLSIVGGLAYVLTDGVTLMVQNPSASMFGNLAFGQIQWGVLGFLGVAVLASLVLRFTTYGRAIYAVGGNPEAAELAGIRVQLVSGSVYVISGACASLAGIMLASQLLAAAPNVGTDTTLNSVAAVILGGAALTGGVGGVPGTVLGVLLLGTVANGLALTQVSSFYQTIATGIILLLAVSFARLREFLRRGKLFASAGAEEPAKNQE